MVTDVKAKVKFLLHNEQFQLDHVLHFNPTRITLIFFDIKIWIFQLFITKRCWQSLLFSTTECSFRRVLIWCKIHYLFTLKSYCYTLEKAYTRPSIYIISNVFFCYWVKSSKSKNTDLLIINRLQISGQNSSTH